MSEPVRGQVGMAGGMQAAFVVDDFVVARRVMGQIPAVGEHAWIGKYRYRVTEVAWVLDDADPDDAGPGGDVVDVRLVEAGRPGRPEAIDDRPRDGPGHGPRDHGGATPG